MQQPCLRQHTERGFTLVELIVVIVVIGALAAMGAAFISKPIEGYVDLARRAELVDAGEHALRLMQRDIRNALPNSLRIKAEGNGNGMVLELIPIIDAGRYRQYSGGGVGHADCRLQFNKLDDSFASTSDLGEDISTDHYVVISNWTSTDPLANAYVGDNRTDITDPVEFDSPTCTGTAGYLPEDRLQIQDKKFPFTSDRQRFYVVDTPVTYLCNTSEGTLTQHTGYDFVEDQNGVDTVGELGTGALVTRHLTGCKITYDPGAPERGGLVTLNLTLTDPSSSEQVRLLHQVHVDNAP